MEESGPCYVPSLGDSAVWSSNERHRFSDWWDQEVYETHRGLKLTRKNLVFALRTTDGGSHVDEILSDEAYHWLATKGDANTFAVDGGIVGTISLDGSEIGPPPGQDAKPILHGHWATMRQIVWELDDALIGLGY